MRQAERDQRQLNQPTVVTHTIKIQEKVKDPNFRLANVLPKVGVLADGSPDPNYYLYAKGIQLASKDSRGEKDNRMRVLNMNNGYDGLHSSNREGGRKLRSAGVSLKSNYRNTVSKLAGGNSAVFRNIHTSYGNGVHKRFK